jgi:hypothetical protein
LIAVPYHNKSAMGPPGPAPYAQVPFGHRSLRELFLAKSQQQAKSVASDWQQRFVMKPDGWGVFCISVQTACLAPYLVTLALVVFEVLVYHAYFAFATWYYL